MIPLPEITEVTHVNEHTYFACCDSLYRVNAPNLDMSNIPQEVLDKWLKQELQKVKEMNQRKKELSERQEKLNKLYRLKKVVFVLCFLILNLISLGFSIISLGLEGIFLFLLLFVFSTFSFGMSGLLDDLSSSNYIGVI